MLQCDGRTHSAALLIISFYRENDTDADFRLIKINDNGSITAIITC